MSEPHQDESTETALSDAVDAAPKRSHLLVWLRRLLLAAFILLVVFVGFIWHANDAASRAGKGHLV